MNYPIKGYVEASFSDWPGKVASVLFLPRCNFRCPYCHNHGLVLHPDQYPDYPLEEIIGRLRQNKGWIDGICVTGGEPTLHPWLSSLLRELKASLPSSTPLGIKLDTNGSRPEVLRSLLAEGLVDYVAMDLKGPLREDRYGLAAGVPFQASDLARIQSSLGLLLEGGIDYEFRTTVVPGLLEEEDIYHLARRLEGAKRYRLQNFNPKEAMDRKLRTLHSWSEQDLVRMQQKVNSILRGH